MTAYQNHHLPLVSTLLLGESLGGRSSVMKQLGSLCQIKTCESKIQRALVNTDLLEVKVKAKSTLQRSGVGST